MVSINTTSGYGLLSSYGSSGLDQAQPKAAAAYARNAATAGTSATSVSVSLSEEARAALSVQTDTRPLAGVVSATRSALDALLKDAKAVSALKDGRATIDVSGLDRRSLWAAATNSGGGFAIEEQVVATLQLNDGRDKALAGGAAAVRVTGDYAALYRSYLATLDAAGPEEKSTVKWTADRTAVIAGLDQAIARPGAAPVIDGDPVAAWLKESGGIVASPRTRDIDKVAMDVRAVLDRQYADSDLQGPSSSRDGGSIDFTRFDNRSLAAVALNKGGLFTDHEIALASLEVRTRAGNSVSSHYTAASESGDASAFGKSIITQYAGMSDEERQAAGWTSALYDQVVALQDMSERIAAMFKGNGETSHSRVSLLDYL